MLSKLARCGLTTQKRWPVEIVGLTIDDESSKPTLVHGGTSVNFMYTQNDYSGCPEHEAACNTTKSCHEEVLIITL